MRPIINTIKHIVQVPVVTVASGFVGHQAIANAVDAPAVANTSDVNIGSKITAVYVELWVHGDISEATVVCTITKRVAGIAAATFTQMNNLMAWDNRPNILQIHQGLLPTSGNVVPVFREWIKIPKGKQKMRIGDKLTISVAATGTEVHFCGFFVYKEQQ